MLLELKERVNNCKWQTKYFVHCTIYFPPIHKMNSVNFKSFSFLPCCFYSEWWIIFYLYNCTKWINKITETDCVKMRCFSSFEYELVYYTAVLWVVTQRSFTQTPFVGRSVAWRLKDTTRIDLPSSRNQWIRTPKLHCFETALQDGLMAPSTRIQIKNMWFQLSGNYVRVRVDMA